VEGSPLEEPLGITLGGLHIKNCFCKISLAEQVIQGKKIKAYPRGAGFFLPTARRPSSESPESSALSGDLLAASDEARLGLFGAFGGMSASASSNADLFPFGGGTSSSLPSSVPPS
jgi:hypothetical protein